MNLRKFSKKLLSLLIVAVMLVGVCAPVISAAGSIEHLHKDVAGEGNLSYVSLGASNTNGYGHHGYLDAEIYEDPLAAPKAEMNDYGYDKSPANAYPSLIRDALAAQTGREVDLHQLAISSMRVEEVLWLLDDSFVPDDYMNWRFTGGKSWFDMAHKEGGREALRVEYRDYIANADVISVDLGWNNFGVYAFNNIMTILKEGGTRYWKDPDFDSIFDAGMEEEYYAIRDMVVEYINKYIDLSDTALSSEVITKLTDVLTYAAYGACYNFDRVVAQIRALNPDATIVTINIQNLADELIVNLDGTELPLGDLYGELIEFVDLYRSNISPLRNEYLFAYAGVDGDVDTFLDEFRLWDGDPTSLSQDMRDLFDMYDDNLYVRSKIEYMMVGQVFSNLFKTFRDLGASYGLPVFVDDPLYTYDFYLDMSWINGVDLAELDFDNPDTPLEEYGAALSKHLVNLRDYTGDGKNAYNYVFESITQGLEYQMDQVSTQKAIAEAQREVLINTKNSLVQGKKDLEAQLEVVTDPDSKAELEKTIAEFEATIAECDGGIAQYNAGIAEADAGIAQLKEAIEVTIPYAKAMFDQMYAGLYQVYVNTLYYAYDTVGTIIQYTLQFNTFYMTSEGMANHNKKTDELLGYVVDTFTNNTMLKFYEELGKLGLDNSGATAPEITVNEELFKDLGIQAACALEVRYDFGNSFFAHPSVKGNQQICDAVMNVLVNGSDAEYFGNQKIYDYMDVALQCINLSIDYITYVAKMHANATYDYLVETVDGFDDEYLKFVELVGAYVDRVDPAIGVAVRNYLIDTPNDAIDIICQYGDDAVIKFIVDAADAIDTISASLSACALVWAEHGSKIYDEIAADEEYQKLIADIEKKTADLIAIYNNAHSNPMGTIHNIDAIIEKESAELTALYAQLFNVISKNVEKYDEEVAELLWIVLNDVAEKAFEVLPGAGNDYLVWLEGHAIAMCGALLNSFLENTYELGTAIDDAIWARINNVVLAIIATYNDIKQQINLQIGIVKDFVTPDQSLLDSLNDLENWIDSAFEKMLNEFKSKFDNLANDLLDRTLDSLKENAPYIDEKLYDYFYNNPEEVIDFLNKYGHYVEGVANKYGDEALAVVGYILYAYGEDFAAYVIENPELVFENIVGWYNTYGVRIWPMVKVYLDVLGIEFTMVDPEAVLMNIYDKLNDLANEALDKINSLTDEAFGEILALIEAKIEYLQNLTDEQKLAINNEIDAFLTMITDRIIETIGNAFNGRYTPDNDSYYVAITGNDAEYAEMLALALGLADKHSVMGWDNIDESILNNADFVTIGYDRTQISGFAMDQLLAYVALYGDDTLRTQITDYLRAALADKPEADAEGIIASVNTLIDTALAGPQLSGKTMVDLDWAGLVGEENVALVEALLNQVADKLAEKGIDGDITVSVNVADIMDKYFSGEGMSIDIFDSKPVFEVTIPMADMIMIYVESYLYANIAFEKQYGETILNLIENNPDVQIALLGQYNPFNDITVMGVDIPLNDIYGRIVKASNIHSLAYALALSNVTYVDISEAETSWDAIDDAAALIEAYMTNPQGEEFTDESDLYIMNQILAAYGLECKHAYDNCVDMRCNICGELRNEPGHDYSAVITAPDCVNGGFTTYTCIVCGHSYVADKTAALGHTYDNACDADCNVCGEQRTPADHEFGDWEVKVPATEGCAGSEERHCLICGHTETREIAPLPAPTDVEDTLSVGETIAIVCGALIITIGVIAAIASLNTKVKRSKKA